MKILFLTVFPRGLVTTGQGLIATKLQSELNEISGISATYALFRSTERPGAGNDPVFEIAATPMSRSVILKGLLGAHDGWPSLRKALFETKEEFDFIIWMGLAADPVAALLPSVLGSKVIYYLVDSPTLHARRRVGGMIDFLRYHAMRRREARILRSGYKSVIYVTREDVETARHIIDGHGCDIDLLPIGIDTREWELRPSTTAVGDKVVAIFSGVMNYRPNVDAARHFIQDILPLIRSQCRIFIVGKDPAQEVIDLQHRDPRVVVTGSVPSVAEYLRKSDIFIAPMVRGAGIKIKVLQALATGLPVVATSECVRAFGSNIPGIMVGESSVAFATLVDQLAMDSSLRRRIGMAGREFVENGWSWASRAEKLLEILQR